MSNVQILLHRASDAVQRDVHSSASKTVPLLKPKGNITMSKKYFGGERRYEHFSFLADYQNGEFGNKIATQVLRDECSVKIVKLGKKYCWRDGLPKQDGGTGRSGRPTTKDKAIIGGFKFFYRQETTGLCPSAPANAHRFAR
jgi:hypothetical protein